MNTSFHTASFVSKFMPESIAHCRLDGPTGGGGLALLSNAHCEIILENIDDDYVRFEFRRPGEMKPVWELAAYLNCRFMAQGGAYKLRPKPPGGLSKQEKFEWYLQRFDEVLVLGYLDAPLNGDYTWADAYTAAAEEFENLSTALYRLRMAKHPEAERLYDMLTDGNRAWMAEVREILEQTRWLSGSQDSQNSQD